MENHSARLKNSLQVKYELPFLTCILSDQFSHSLSVDRARATALVGRVGAERVASDGGPDSLRAKHVVLHSPLRTRRATFTATGSPSVSLTQLLVESALYFISFRDDSITFPSDYIYSASPNRLRPFALCLAFPSSDYYDRSDSHISLWRTTHLSILM